MRRKLLWVSSMQWTRKLPELARSPCQPTKLMKVKWLLFVTLALTPYAFCHFNQLVEEQFQNCLSITNLHFLGTCWLMIMHVKSIRGKEMFWLPTRSPLIPPCWKVIGVLYYCSRIDLYWAGMKTWSLHEVFWLRPSEEMDSCLVTGGWRWNPRQPVWSPLVPRNWGLLLPKGDGSTYSLPSLL